MKHLCKSLFSEGCALRTRLDTSQKNMYVCSYPAIPIVPTLIFFLRQSAKNYGRPTCQVTKNLFKKCF